MGINTFPAAASGATSIGTPILGNKYGTPSSVANKTDITVTANVPAGAYIAYYNTDSLVRVIFGTETLDLGSTSPQPFVISTAQSSFTWRATGYYNESIQTRNLVTRIGGSAYGNGYYVIAGGNTNEGCISTDGANWSTKTGIGTAYLTNSRELSFVNGFFILNGPAGRATNTNILISTDATNWTSRLVATSVSPTGPWQYASAQGLYWNAYVNGGIVVSSNLSTFTTRASIAGSGDGQSKFMFYVNPWWIMADNNGFFVSTNGTTWANQTILSGFSPIAAAYGNGRLVVNFNSTTTTAVSTDMVNWTTGAFSWSSATNQQNMVFGNGYFMSTGPGLNSRTGILTSTDGLNWVERSSGAQNIQTQVMWGSSGGYVLLNSYLTQFPEPVRTLQVGGKTNNSNGFILQGTVSAGTPTYASV